MSLVQPIVQPQDHGVCEAFGPDGLASIHRPDCGALLWRRDPQPAFQSWIDGLDPANLPQTRVVLTPQQARDAVNYACDLVDTPDGPQREHLISDIAELCAVFAKVMKAPYLRLRLDAVTTNACRKFHIDAVTARLVCTYRGTGTQLGLHSDEPQPFLTVPAGAPILLRGTRWPPKPQTGLLHRSPPIEGSGETRLLLVLDPVLTAHDEDGTARYQ